MVDTRDVSHNISVASSLRSVFLGIAIYASWCGDSSVHAESSAADVHVESDIVCGSGGGRELRLDLARAVGAGPGEVRPCVVVIHGGAWRGGAKEHMHQMVRELASRGYVSASLQYRLCPEHRFPAQIEDVKCAVRFLRAHADEYGIDRGQFGAIGLSAGAHLAMLLGTMDDTDGFHGSGGWQEQSDKVRVVVSYCGPSDLSAEDLPDESRRLVSDFLGGTETETARLQQDASPVTWVSRNDGPMLLFQGTRDHLVPASQAWKMAEKLTDAGTNGRVELLIGAGHGWVGADLTRSLSEGYGFIERYLPIVKQPERESEVDAAGSQLNDFISLFDGRSLDGWEGDSSVFRVEDESIVGGDLTEPVPHNFFLASRNEYSDFELQLEFRLSGEQTNAGIQLRSVRIPDHHEMIGYQADLGQEYWGCLYDESRRNRVLAAPDAVGLAAVLKKSDWNSYRILCEGPRIQLWINGFQTADYSEDDAAVPRTGRLALQIHGGPPGEARYRKLRIREIAR